MTSPAADKALAAESVAKFLRSHRLPDAFRELIDQHYLPLADWLAQQRAPSAPLLLGINGAQGTGKSTLADFLQLALEQLRDWRVAVLSIDDFYLTKAERSDLADRVHPLLATRGVPGTHDVEMLERYLDRLAALGGGDQCALPRFDKAEDDRAAEADWPRIAGPVDLIILEGWCVGSVAQDDAELGAAMNALERDHDRTGAWRRYANEQLRTSYSQLFARLDVLVFLQAPSFDAIYRWRLEQEHKLAASAPAGAAGIMADAEVAKFIENYERITRNNLTRLPDSADVVLELNEDHGIVASRYSD